jgi:hypothetical protein
VSRKLEPEEVVGGAEAATLAPLEKAPPSDREAIRDYFEPLFAGTGGIDSWIGEETPNDVVERLSRLDEEPIGRAQLSQLLILSHEAGLSDGFFDYYWLRTPSHTYDVRIHGVPEDGFDPSWTDGTHIRSLAHLRWGFYRFYVDALLYFGNVRSAYRTLRDKTQDELEEFFSRRSINTESLRNRGPALPLQRIAKDDRYLVAEYACKSLDSLGGESELQAAALDAYRAHVSQGGSSLVSVDELLKGEFIEQKYPGRQQQFTFTADDILTEVVGSEEELNARLKGIAEKFQKARNAALHNTRLYLSMVEELDVYVATSMRTRDNFRRMAEFCDEVFSHEDLSDLNLRYFDPTLSAAEGHVDKGLIECLMVDAAKILVYYAGDRESLGKDFEAAMALSRGKPVVFFCDDEQKERMYRYVHPLTRLVEFDTGVAIGAMVTTTTEAATLLLSRILGNRMEYEIHKTDVGSLHLRERLTDSLVRLQTHDRLLQETFWNYYHRKGVLD